MNLNMTLKKVSLKLFTFLGAMLIAQTSWAVDPEILQAFISVPENTVEVLTPVDVSNPDGNALTFSLDGGGDEDKFEIDPVLGNLVFTTAPDFENPTDSNKDNSYIVTVKVVDTAFQFDTRTFSVAVVNDPADDIKITQDADFSVVENTVEVTPTIAVFNPAGGGLTYSIENSGDGDKFQIDGPSGALSFAPPPDFENPTDIGADNTYTLTITVMSDNGSSDSKTFFIEVTDLPGFEKPTAVLSIEEPSTQFPRTGVSNLRGWAVSKAPIERLELFVDGDYYADVPMGGLRQDIAAAFPKHHQPERSGFSMAFPYLSLDVDPIRREGIHTVLVRAFDVDGYITEASTNFLTVRFTDEFIHDPNLMSLAGASFVYVDITYGEPADGFLGEGEEKVEDGTGFLVQKMALNGINYDIVLEWQVATQQFEMIMIRPSALRSTPFGGVTYSAEVPEIELTNTSEATQPLILKIEEPISGVTSSGISNLRGWVVSSSNVDKVELFVDGNYWTDIPQGGTRDDVASAFPEYPNSALSGFSMAFPYSELTQDKHTFLIRATNIEGAVTEQVVRFPSVRFTDSFVSIKKDVEVSKVVGDIRKRDQRIILDNVIVKNGPFSEIVAERSDKESESLQIILQWVAATQQFEIQKISKMPDAGEDGGGSLGGGPPLGTN